MALYTEDGTEIADAAAFEALTTPVETDPPLRVDEPIYETFAYPSSTDTSGPGAPSQPAGVDDLDERAGKRLKFPAGAIVPTSEVTALFAGGEDDA